MLQKIGRFVVLAFVSCCVLGAAAWAIHFPPDVRSQHFGFAWSPSVIAWIVGFALWTIACTVAVFALYVAGVKKPSRQRTRTIAASLFLVYLLYGVFVEVWHAREEAAFRRLVADAPDQSHFQGRSFPGFHHHHLGYLNGTFYAGD